MCYLIPAVESPSTIRRWKSRKKTTIGTSARVATANMGPRMTGVNLAAEWAALVPPREIHTLRFGQHDHREREHTAPFLNVPAERALGVAEGDVRVHLAIDDQPGDRQDVERAFALDEDAIDIASVVQCASPNRSILRTSVRRWRIAERPFSVNRPVPHGRFNAVCFVTVPRVNAAPVRFRPRFPRRSAPPCGR